ncbi:MAG: MFS transporter, partial [Oscillospiraceae bacterium]|nr:MFS transporter [Oscillospiraceae bacterium]
MGRKKKGNALGGRVWAALLAFGLIGQIAWVVENMYFNVFLYNTITGDTKAIAAMVAASAVVAAITTLVVGALSDKLGVRKKIIVFGYLLWGLSVMAFALVRVSGLEALVGPARAVQAAAVTVIVLDCVMTFFGSSANDAAFNAWVTDVTNDGNRGRVEAVLAVMPLVAMLVVFGALDGLTAAGNWTAFFLIVGARTMAGGGLGHLLIQEPEGLQPAKGNYFANIFYGLRPGVIWANPALYLALLALAVYAASQQVYMPYLIIYIQRYLGVDNYALILGTVLIAASIVSVACGRVIDRRGKLHVAVPAAAAAFVGLVCMFFVRGMVPVILAGTLMLGASMVLSACLQGLIRDHTPQAKAGQFQGIRILFQVLLPMVTGPYIGAAVIGHSGQTYEDLGTVKEVPTPEIFIASALVLLLIAIPIALLRRREPRHTLSRRVLRPMLTAWGEKLDRDEPLPEYPRPQLRRDSYLNLNGRWQYAIRPMKEKQPKTFDGEIIVPYSPECLLSGVQRTVMPEDRLCYKRTFTLPDGFRKDRVLLHFGAVDQSCE